MFSTQQIDTELLNNPHDVLRNFVKDVANKEQAAQALYDLYMKADIQPKYLARLQPIKYKLENEETNLTAKQAILDVLIEILEPEKLASPQPTHSLPTLLAFGAFVCKKKSPQLYCRKIFELFRLEHEQIKAFFAGYQTGKFTILNLSFMHNETYHPATPPPFNTLKFNEIISELSKLNLSNIEILNFSNNNLGLMDDHDELRDLINRLKALRLFLPALNKIVLKENCLWLLEHNLRPELLSAFGNFPSGLSLDIRGNAFFSHFELDQKTEFYSELRSLNVTTLQLGDDENPVLRHDDLKQFFDDIQTTPVRSLDIPGTYKHLERFNTYDCFKDTNWCDIFFNGVTTLKLPSLTLNPIWNKFDAKLISEIFERLKSTSVKELDISKSDFSDCNEAQFNAFIQGLEIAGIRKLNLRKLKSPIPVEIQQRINQVIWHNNIVKEFAQGSLKAGIFCKMWGDPNSDVSKAIKQKEADMSLDMQQEYAAFSNVASRYLKY